MTRSYSRSYSTGYERTLTNRYLPLLGSDDFLAGSRRGSRRYSSQAHPIGHRSSEFSLCQRIAGLSSFDNNALATPIIEEPRAQRPAENRRASEAPADGSVSPTHVGGDASPTNVPVQRTVTGEISLNTGDSSTLGIDRGASIVDTFHKHDPHNFMASRKHQDEMAEIKNRFQARNFIKNPRDAGKARNLHQFYLHQNELIDDLLTTPEQHREVHDGLRLKYEKQIRFAINASLVLNICLAFLQIYAAATAGSMSLWTTMADALFDPISSIVLKVAEVKEKRANKFKWPAGKSRIRTAANITFCFLMTAVALVLIVQSIRELVAREDEGLKKFHLPSLIIVAISFCSKAFMFMFCFRLRNMDSTVHMYMEDHRNDLAINGLGLITSLLGSKVKWWIDPTGSIILSVIIGASWLETAYTEFKLLVGVTAPQDYVNMLTYNAYRHSPLIKTVKQVQAWHSGAGLFVEIRIAMEPETDLKTSHELAASLEDTLLDLPKVERVYVLPDIDIRPGPDAEWHDHWIDKSEVVAEGVHKGGFGQKMKDFAITFGCMKEREN